MSWAYYIAKGRSRNNSQSVRQPASQSARRVSRKLVSLQPSIQSNVRPDEADPRPSKPSSHPVKKMDWPSRNYQSRSQPDRQTDRRNPATCSVQTTPQLRRRGNSFSLTDTVLNTACGLVAQACLNLSSSAHPCVPLNIWWPESNVFHPEGDGDNNWLWTDWNSGLRCTCHIANHQWNEMFGYALYLTPAISRSKR